LVIIKTSKKKLNKNINDYKNQLKIEIEIFLKKRNIVNLLILIIIGIIIIFILMIMKKKKIIII
jgi:hypothetical protein